MIACLDLKLFVAEGHYSMPPGYMIDFLTLQMPVENCFTANLNNSLRQTLPDIAVNIRMHQLTDFRSIFSYVGLDIIVRGFYCL